MQTSFNALLAVSAAALLAACGGGSDATAPTSSANQPAWGSPAMFVPAGQTQVSVSVSDCTSDSGSRAKSSLVISQRSSSVSVTSPSLIITSAGDVIFSGAIAPATAVTELARVNFATSTDRQIEFSSDATSNTFDVSNATTNLYMGRSGGAARFNAYVDGGIDISCNTVANLSPAYAPSEARLAAKFTNGVTSWQNSQTSVSGTSTIAANNIVVWDNKSQNTVLDSNQTDVRYASLNVASGALNVGPSETRATQSVVLSTALATSGYYFEGDNEDSDYVSGRYKQVVLRVDTATQGQLKFTARTGDNILTVVPQLGTFNFMAPILP